MALDARDFLSRHCLEYFARPDTIVTVSASDTVLQAMKAMAEADILCAPVKAENPASDSFSDRCVVTRLASRAMYSRHSRAPLST
jgi:CBS domain-containing protein